MRILYSFIIDGGGLFSLHAKVFLSTLLMTGVPPGDILAFATPRAGEDALRLARKLGITIIPFAPILDHKCCNKIALLPYLAEKDADLHALCDTDIAFLQNLANSAWTDTVRAKVVDVQIPTLEKLNTLRERAGIKTEPRIIQTTCDHRYTYSTNCNGGIYILSPRILKSLANSWYKYAEFAGTQDELLGQRVRHADQIGFCLAMLSLDLDVDELLVEWNFPMHVTRRFPDLAFVKPRILHYHRHVSRAGFLTHTNQDFQDGFLSDINARLSDFYNRL